MSKKGIKATLKRLWQRVALWRYNTAFIQRCIQHEIEKEKPNE